MLHRIDCVCDECLKRIREGKEEMSCPICKRVSGCDVMKHEQSNDHDMVLRAGSTHRVGDIEKMNENKSWNEFVLWINNGWPNIGYVDNYPMLKPYEKIGLLIEYLKSVGLRHEKEIVLSDLEVEKLEAKVKSLKPVDEVEKLAKELCDVHGNQFDEFMNQKQWWINVAQKAIEIIKGK